MGEDRGGGATIRLLPNTPLLAAGFIILDT